MKLNKQIIQAGALGLLVMTTSAWSQTTQATDPIEPKSKQQIDAIDRSQSDLVVVKHADGSESVDLKGRFQIYSVATVVNGEVVYSCQDHEQLGANHSHGQLPPSSEKRGDR